MLLYVKHLTLQEVCHVIGVTESRVSQIHSGVRKKLRERMTGTKTRCCSWTRDLRQAPLEERALDRVRRRARARAVGGGGLVAAAEPAQQVGAGGVEEVVAVERVGAARRSARGPRSGPSRHRDRDGAVERDDRASGPGREQRS